MGIYGGIWGISIYRGGIGYICIYSWGAHLEEVAYLPRVGGSYPPWGGTPRSSRWAP